MDDLDTHGQLEWGAGLGLRRVRPEPARRTARLDALGWYFHRQLADSVVLRGTSDRGDLELLRGAGYPLPFEGRDKSEAGLNLAARYGEWRLDAPVRAAGHRDAGAHGLRRRSRVAHPPARPLPRRRDPGRQLDPPVSCASRSSTTSSTRPSTYPALSVDWDWRKYDVGRALRHHARGRPHGRVLTPRHDRAHGGDAAPGRVLVTLQGGVAAIVCRSSSETPGLRGTISGLPGQEPLAARVHGRREQVPLGQRTAQLRQQRSLLLGLHPFRDDVEAQAVGQADHRAHDAGVAAGVARSRRRRSGRSSACRRAGAGGSSATSSRCRSRRSRCARRAPSGAAGARWPPSVFSMTMLSVTSSLSRRAASPDSAQRGVHLLDQVGLGELLDGEVDADDEVARRTSSCQSGGLAARLLQDGRARGATMRPVSSARGMNSDGATRPRSGCCQRTRASKPGDPAVVHAHDGLVVHAELPAVDGAPQVVLELQRACAHARAWRSRTPGDATCRGPWRGTSRCPRRGGGPRRGGSRGRRGRCRC